MAARAKAGMAGAKGQGAMLAFQKGRYRVRLAAGDDDLRARAKLFGKNEYGGYLRRLLD